MDNSFFNQKPRKGWLFIFSALILVILLITGVEALYVFEKRYEYKIVPGITFRGTSLSGLTADEAGDVIEKILDQAAAQGFKIVSKEQTFTITPVVTSEMNPELSYRLINFKVEEMAARAMEPGHDKNTLKSLWKKFVLLAKNEEIKPLYEINRDALREILKQKFHELEQEPEDSKLAIKSDLTVSFTKSKSGITIDYDALIAKISGRLQNLDLSTIAIYPKLTEPEIRETEAASAVAEAETIIAVAPVEITYGENKYTLSKRALGEMLALRKIGGGVIIILDKGEFDRYLDGLAAKIETAPQELKLTLLNGQVADFTPPRDGLQIERGQNYSLFTKNIIREKQKTMELAVTKTSPRTQVGDVNNLNIKEIVGTGVTSFVGSPKNRVANIGVGVKKLSGLVIQPGEEFSVISALKPIDQASGYLPELVIKKDKTIPEFGGGLCQIGTTMFRVALDAGLPILKRAPHSYRVPYYEPPVGMDATIYDPSPDLVFKNNYPTALLLQGYVRGTKLTFELWGAKDGRQIDIGKPQVYNTTPPPPKREVQTEDLPAGTKKCTERAHAGADAKFTYTVTLPDGAEYKKEFRSHYIPWGEVCLIGVPKGTLTSSTPPISP